MLTSASSGTGAQRFIVVSQGSEDPETRDQASTGQQPQRASRSRKFNSKFNTKRHGPSEDRLSKAQQARARQIYKWAQGSFDEGLDQYSVGEIQDIIAGATLAQHPRLAALCERQEHLEQATEAMEIACRSSDDSRVRELLKSPDGRQLLWRRGATGELPIILVSPSFSIAL